MRLDVWMRNREMHFCPWITLIPRREADSRRRNDDGVFLRQMERKPPRALKRFSPEDGNCAASALFYTSARRIEKANEV